MELRYRPEGEVLKRFLRSRAFIQGIRGPFGSGKSTACVMKLLHLARRWPRCRDGVRRTRWVVVRNTYPELKTTTIKTWHQWVPPTVGRWLDSGPPTHYLKFDDVQMEVVFLALDRAEDVAKLLSFEPTGAWINEAREVPKVVLDHLSGRCGRYPSPALIGPEGRGWSGVLMDTNPPDTDHWWYEMAEDMSEERAAELAKVEEELRAIGALEKGQALIEFFGQPGGRSPQAENLANLPPGYYIRMVAGKAADWIRVYIDGEYGYVRVGVPVFQAYRDAVHCVAFEPGPRASLVLGLDFGLTPACSFLVSRGTFSWGVHRELVSSRMSLPTFAGEIKHALLTHYPGWQVSGIWGDPSGEAGQSADAAARTGFEILRANGLPAWPAPGNNDPVERVEVVNNLLQRLDVEGPGFVIHPQAKKTRKGFAGKYHYPKLHTSGPDERWHDKPLKNEYSHPCEAAEYGLLGAGMGRVIVRRSGGGGSLQTTAEA